MPDPFLLAHQVAESVFDIGSKLYPVSIRDQMVRGQSIIDRAVAAGFAPTGRELLVIGAGAAGAVAAIRAATLGIRTHLIEFDARPFSRQDSCRTRWIDPHEYEWPFDQWPNQTYAYNNPPLHPYYGHPVPLPWSAQWADSLAAGWAMSFGAALGALPNLTFYPSTSLLPPPAPAPVFNAGARTWTVHLSSGVVLTVGMIVNAVGFGVERCDVPRLPPPMYRGLAFWQTDRFRRPNCGLPAPKVAKVIISGGGDGALQDFLRIVTRQRSVRRLYHAIVAAISGGTAGQRARRKAILSTIRGRISGAENRALRSYLWGSDSVHDHDVHRLLHLAHLDAVGFALGRVEVVAALKAILPSPAPYVLLVHPCIHFTQSYSFNRFLVLLIDTYLSQRDGAPSRIVAGAEVVSVVGTGGHVCNTAHPRWCLGQPHEVGLGPALHPTCGAAWAPPLPAPVAFPCRPLDANIVIIRHGVTGIGPAPGPWKTLAHIGHPRQILPLHPSRG